MQFRFPVPTGYKEEPVWTGKDFQVGSNTQRILRYTSNDGGWNAGLTEFHEQVLDTQYHFMEKASRSHACKEVTNHIPYHQAIVLEIGSSSGYLLNELKLLLPGSVLIGSDCVIEPLETIAKNIPDIPLLEFDLVTCPLPDECIDMLVALNVLEHIEDDVTALNQIYRILKPGGYAILEVPTNPKLYDFYDEQLKHFRRYDTHDLIKKAKGAGFTIIHVSHLGFFIYPMFKFVKYWNSQKEVQTNPEKQMLMQNIHRFGGAAFNNIMSLIMKIELKLGKYINYPWGIRGVITLKKQPFLSILPKQ